MPNTPQIRQADALALMAGIEAATVDAVITDPPYCAGAISEAQRTQAKGQGLRSETLRRFGWFTGDNMGTAGLAWLLRAVALESARILKPSGSLLVFLDWRMLPALEPAIESAGLRWQNLLVWDKETMGLGAGFRAQHELILHFTNGGPEYHDKSTSNVIRCRRVPKHLRTHQTEKPVDLLVDLIRVTTPPGGLVVDPFMGSGAVLAAAHRIGRRAVGGDMDPQHVTTAAERFTQAPLFDLANAENVEAAGHHAENVETADQASP